MNARVAFHDTIASAALPYGPEAHGTLVALYRAVPTKAAHVLVITDLRASSRRSPCNRTRRARCQMH
ncbi:protein of unknown function (plasmid) [Caballeronia sp. S22]